MPGPDLDAIDRAILYRLQEDASQPITDIAETLNVADNTVRNRIRSLEESGVIQGYQATVDYDAAGVEHYYGFMCSVPVRERESLAEQARELGGVVEVITFIGGKENLYILGAAARKDDITALAYRIDELGIVIEREDLVNDHVRRPFDGFRDVEAV